MPRSLGCATCKRRKVRCDEARPSCERCIKAKLDCPGYEPPDNPAPKSHTFAFKDQTDLTIARASGAGSASRQSQPPQEEGSSSSSLASPVGHAALNLNASESQLYSTFLENFLPQDRGPGQLASSYLTDPHTNNPSTHALRSATQALSFVRLSALENDHNLIQHSRVAYGASLSQLRQALSSSELANQDETLATILLLGFYELHKAVQEPSVGSINHYSGASRYIQQRGPASFRTPYSLVLLNNHRNVTLMAGLKNHKRIMYDRPEWLSITRECSECDDWSALIDVGVFIPGCLAGVDMLVQQPDAASRTETATKALDQLKMLQLGLDQWLERSRQKDNNCWLVPLARVPGLSPGMREKTPLDQAYTGRVFNHVHNFLLYNFFMGSLLRAMLQLHYYRQLGQPAASDSLGTLESDYRTHLAQLCRCFPYMLRPESSTVGWLVMMSALWFARHALQELDMHDLATWCDAIEEHASRHNLNPLPSVPLTDMSTLRPTLE